MGSSTPGKVRTTFFASARLVAPAAPTARIAPSDASPILSAQAFVTTDPPAPLSKKNHAVSLPFTRTGTKTCWAYTSTGITA
jgi:hypothetical protein